MSSWTIHLCVACQSRFIMSYDQHASCQGCPCRACTVWTRPCREVLLLKERQCRVTIFTPSAEEFFPVADHYLLDKALDFLHGRWDSNHSASNKGIVAPFQAVVPKTGLLPPSGCFVLRLTFSAIGALIIMLPDDETEAKHLGSQSPGGTRPLFPRRLGRDVCPDAHQLPWADLVFLHWWQTCLEQRVLSTYVPITKFYGHNIFYLFVCLFIYIFTCFKHIWSTFKKQNAFRGFLYFFYLFFSEVL